MLYLLVGEYVGTRRAVNVISSDRQIPGGGIWNFGSRDSKGITAKVAAFFAILRITESSVFGRHSPVCRGTSGP